MMKFFKYFLVILPILLISLLGINIYKYYTYKNENQSIIENTNDIELKINDDITKKDNLNNELISLKKEKEDKIWEYERWIKWNKEILDMIN